MEPRRPTGVHRLLPWLGLLLLAQNSWEQTMLPNSGVLYPSDAIGVAALSMRDLEQGLCPSTPTGTVPVEEDRKSVV